MGSCGSHVWPHAVHDEHRWHVDPQDVDIHVSWTWSIKHVYIHAPYVGEGSEWGMGDLRQDATHPFPLGPFLVG